MARVPGPLFSMSASGTIAKALTFAAWKGIAYVRGYFIPANPNTQIQQNVRKALALVVAYWQVQDPGDQTLWNTFAEGTGMSGYNQFCSRGLAEYNVQLTSAVDPLSVTVDQPAPGEAWIWLPVV